MQSGGQAAGIQLQVGLDLAFFRSQLVGLQAVTTGTKLSFGVTFKRLDIQNELNALATNIKKRNYFLEVKTNLANEIELAKQLATALDKLGRSQQTAKTGVGQRLGVGAIGRTPLQGGLGSKDVEKLYRASARAGLLVFDKEIARTKVSMVAAMDAIGVDAIAGLLNGLSSQDARLRAAAESIGENLIKTTKTSLGIASPSKKFEEIGKNVGKGFEKGALSSMDSAFDAMENKMRQRGKILDAIARGIFGMLGMDPAAMMQQARQQRLPAAINWQATTPPRQPFTGPSSGGRALPPGPSQMMLPGTSFGRQKYLPTALGEELKKVLRDAANAFVDTLKTQIRTAKVLDLGRTMQPTLPGSTRIAGLLSPEPPGRYRAGRTEETQAELFARREREARMRSALRGVDVMGETPTRAPAPYSYANRPAMPRRPTSAIVPYEGGGALVPTGGGAGGGVPPRPPSGGGGMGGMGGFSRALGGINLPGTGVVREIGSEFAMAAKQVLLFGTAYKALAFLTSFPAQVGQAVGALQSFNNTLKAISPTANEAKASNQFILDIVDRYNVPLQSARDGFTKLYASMAPAGFKGDEIRALFTGVSQAAATFGMSADKVDRVNYAFAQMASKGQVMSEELKGQLGDVLPGAMGIFAEAAGFKGPDAIQKFSKALEDGAYKGEAMRGLLKNVTVVLTKEFGPGAEGAARTFQGVINRMQNSTRLLYEAFEPVAVGFLNSVVVPLTSGIKTITDGFNAFFTGTQAKTAGGMAFAQELERLKPAFEGIRANVAALMPVLQGFGKTLLEIGKVALQIAGNPLVGYLGRLYLIILPINMALGVLRGLWASNALQLVIFNARVANGTSTLTAFRGMMAATGATATITAGRIRAFSIALQAAFSATAIGLVVVGLGMIAEAFMTAGARADAARQKMSQFADSVKQLGAIGDVAGATAEKVGQQALASRLQNAKTLLQQVKAEGKKLTKSQVDELKALQLTGNLEFIEVGRGAEKGLFGATGKITNLLGTQAALQAEIDSAERGRLETQTRIVQATRAVTEAKKNQGKEEAKLQKIDLSGGDGTGKKPKEQSLESYYSLQDQLAKAQTQADIDRIQELFDHRKNLINSAYDLEEARANGVQKQAIAHQRAISDIFLDLQRKQLNARLDVIRAQGSVAGGAGGAMATGGGGKGLGAGIAQYITGDPSSPFYKADHGGGNYHEHLAFVSRQAAEEAYKKLTSAGVQVTEFKGKSRVGKHTPGSAHYEGLAFDVPGAQVPVGKERELTARVQSILGIGGAGSMAPGKVTGDRKRDELATQQLAIAQQNESIALKRSEAEAMQRLVVETEKYLGVIFNVAEKQFELGMVQTKISLLRSGATEQEIEDAMALEEINLKYKAGVEQSRLAIEANEQLKKLGIINQDELNKRNEYQNFLIKKLGEELPKAVKAQQDLNKAAREYAFSGRVKALEDEIKLLLIVNTEERRLAELRKQYGSDEEAQKIFDLEKIKKNIEDTRALIDGFVSQTSSDYKGFLKAVISGEDAADALKQFQEGLKDRVLTIFLDFAMAPVEKFLKESLEGLFLPKAKKETGELPKETTKDPVEATNSNTNATVANTAALEKVAGSLASTGGSYSGLSEATINQGFGNIGGASFGGMQLPGLDKVLENIDFETAFEPLQKDFGATLENLSSTLDTNAYSLSQSAIDYSANFKNVGDSAKKMAEDAGKAAEDAGKNGEDMKEALGKTAAGIGIAAGAIMGIAAGISQIKKGGAGNTLMGIGSIMASVGGAIGGFTKLAGANGGIAGGGWKPFPVSAFASGGTVKGPTLGLVGEGKYNEAIVPLPDGRSIPVQMRGAGGSGSRDLLANQAQSRPSPSVLSMSFQSTTINGVEYVDRAQLEAAMEETRRAASREGASKGANLAIDRLANSPSSRRRAGIR